MSIIGRMKQNTGVTGSKRYRIILQYHYFSRGKGLLAELKYVFLSPYLLTFTDFPGGISSGTISLAAFCMLTWVIGRAWFQRPGGKLSLVEIEAEVGNQFNLFQQELRRKYKN